VPRHGPAIALTAGRSQTIARIEDRCTRRDAHSTTAADHRVRQPHATSVVVFRGGGFRHGFDWHPHRGMETVTYVIDGSRTGDTRHSVIDDWRREWMRPVRHHPSGWPS